MSADGRRIAADWVLRLGRHAWLVTAALCLLVAAVGLHGEDLPAQSFRVWLFRTHGFVLWDTRWYGGHADVGYGPLFPVVGAVLGVVPAGALACVLATVLFGKLVGPADRLSIAAIRLAFSIAVVVDLVVGRMPFAWGLTCGLAALVAIRSRRPWLALGAAVACSLFSPLAALFLLLAGLAWLPDLGWRRTLPLLGALTGLGVAAATGDGGVFPFPAYLLAGQLALVAACFAVTPSEQRVLRRGLVLYGLACVALFVVPNPVGGNVVRLASLVAGPLVVYLIIRTGGKAAIALGIVLVPVVVWQTLPVDGAIAASLHDPSTQAEYYTGVVGYLEHNLPVGSSVEVPPTSQHWEATYVAEHVPLARGWDRQVDLQRNVELYRPLSAASYRTWLLDNGVAYVALPRDAELDAGAAAEAALLRHPPSWLVPVHHDSHWQVWRVAGANRLVSGAAHVVSADPGGFSVVFDRPGDALVRERWSPYLHVDSGDACLEPADGGMTTLRSATAGPVTVSARVALGPDTRCPTPE